MSFENSPWRAGLAAVLLIIATAVGAPAPALAQTPASDAATGESVPAAEPGALSAPSESVVADFDIRLESIELSEQDVDYLLQRAENSTGLMAEILFARKERQWRRMFDNIVALAEDVVEQRQQGIDVQPYVERLSVYLLRFPDQARAAMERLRDSVEFPAGDLPPSEYVLADQALLQATGKLDEAYALLIRFIEVGGELGIDTAAEQDYVIGSLQESASSRSAFLQLALNRVERLRGAVSALPEDAELKAMLAASQARVQIASDSLQDILDLMDKFALDSQQYRQQLLATTGALTTDILDVGVVGGLLSQWASTVMAVVASEGPRLLFKVGIAALIVVLFSWLAGISQRLVKRALRSARVNLSVLLEAMVLSSIRNVIFVLGILIALSQVGVSLGPLLAGLGIAGFIIGFALQDSLANFASGMLILLYKPFDVGDFVEAGGVTGTVGHMSMVNTTFKTIDNKVLVVPNNLIWSSVITNFTAQHTRRVDLVFGIAYEDDVDKAQAVLEAIVAEHPATLSDPEPVVRLHELGDSSVNFIVRPWVKTEDYWETYWELTRTVKKRFDAEGISIPFPQRDVHVIGDMGGSASTA
ncbi:MAG: mechanosensitive ion channel domain-containing protein [Pseudomonadota bacterium]